MDYNTAGRSGAGFDDVPMGFGMALAMNETAMQRYASLSVEEKEQLLSKCREVRSKDEMQKLIASLVPVPDADSSYRGPEIK